jgi:hypothetical protein
MAEVRKGRIGSRSINAALADASTLEQYTVAQLPAASASNRGTLVYVTNGAAGAPCVACSNGAAWKVVVNLTIATTAAAA